MHAVKLKIALDRPRYTLEASEISGFCCAIDDIFTLLGCYSAYIGSCSPVFRDSLSVPSVRVF